MINPPETWKDKKTCNSFYTMRYGYRNINNDAERSEHFEVYAKGWKDGATQSTIDMWHYLEGLIIEKAEKGKDDLSQMNESGIWLKLKEASGIANIIEAAKVGYIALDDDSIQHMSEELLDMLDEIRAEVTRDLKQ